MDGTEKEVTLGQLARVVKKSFKRAVLYILVSVIVATAALLSIRAIIAPREFTAAISFTSQSENTLTVMHRNKSEVLNKAVIASNKSLSVAENLIENLTVSAIVPEELELGEAFIPSSFVISLRSTAKVKLTNNEYKSILDKVAAEYINLFAASKLPSSLIDSYTIPAMDSDVEFFQSANDLSENVSLLYNSLVSYVGKYPMLTEYHGHNGKTVSGIITELAILSSRINNLQLQIVINKHEKNNLETVLDGLIAIATVKETAYNTQLTSAENALTNFPNFTLIPDGSTKIDSSVSAMYDTYLQLQQNVSTYTDLLAQATEKKETLVFYKNNLGSTSATDNIEIYNSLTSVSKDMTDILSAYRTLVAEYNDNAYLTSLATIINPAHANRDSYIDGLMIAVVLVAVTIIAYIVAYSKTYSKMKKSGELYDTTAETKDELKF